MSYLCQCWRFFHQVPEFEIFEYMQCDFPLTLQTNECDEIRPLMYTRQTILCSISYMRSALASFWPIDFYLFLLPTARATHPQKTLKRGQDTWISLQVRNAFISGWMRSRSSLCTVQYNPKPKRFLQQMRPHNTSVHQTKLNCVVACCCPKQWWYFWWTAVNSLAVYLPAA